MQTIITPYLVLVFLTLFSLQSLAADGKLLGTAGLNQFEGSGGGGIVPWAVLSGYDSEDEIASSVSVTIVNLDDYRFENMSASASFFDRVELSAARTTFDLTTLGGQIRQNIFGAKYKLYGDLVYGHWPQITAGVQHKRLLDGNVATALGAANSSSGTDWYLAFAKAHIGALNGYNAFWNLTLRATKANQIGLLGFGSASDDSHELVAEVSIGAFLSREIAIGYEYRQKPDNLGPREDAWQDIFITYQTNKGFSLGLAWAELGDIAGAESQNGLFVSLTGYF